MSKKAILAGSNSRLLAKQIASNLKLPLLSPQITRFVNSEMKIALPTRSANFDEVVIVQSTSTPSNDSLMELCFIADTLKREGVMHISAIIPYFGYARQDKQHLPGECVSIEIICNLLQTVGIQKVFTVDIHNTSVLKNVKLTITDKTAMQILAEGIYKDLGLDVTTEADITIASPDDGGIRRAEIFANNFYKDISNKEVVSMEKKRHLDKAHISEAVELRGNIKDKRVIIIDDVSTSGGTLINAYKLCQENGVKEGYVAVVHPDFAFGIADKLENSDIQKIYTTNSIERTVENLDFYDKFKTIDISKLFDF